MILRKHLYRVAFAATTCCALFGCGAASDDSAVTNEPNIEDPLTPDVKTSSCADVNDPWADSLLAVATQSAQTALADMAEAMSNGDMDKVRASSPVLAEAQVAQVLAKYPGHCGAQFAKATLNLTHLARSKDLDTLVQLMGGSEDVSYADEETSYTSSSGILDMQASDMPKVLLKASANVNNADPLTITRLQAVIGSEVLPVLDTTIAYLQNAVNAENFAFRIKRNSEVIEIDRGEAAPALAALQVAKAYVIFFLAQEMEIAKDGSYDWIADLDGLKDFDNLTANQTAALDHLVSMFNTNSVITTIKPSYQKAYAAIPDLLLSAIGNVQLGLKYGLKENETGLLTQANDPYVVGTGSEADVSPADVQKAIDYLERAKKYLQGPVTVKYNNGSNSLTFDVPKYFSIVNGLQDLLPYHQVNPYASWNDSVGVGYYGYYDDEYDIHVRGPFTFTDAKGNPTFGKDIEAELNAIVDEKGLGCGADRRCS